MGGFGRIGPSASTSSATDWGNCRGPRWLSDRMVSLSNHLGFRAHQGFGGDGRFNGLRERMVSLSNHSGFRVLWGFGWVGRFDKLSDRWVEIFGWSRGRRKCM